MRSVNALKTRHELPARISRSAPGTWPKPRLSPAPRLCKLCTPFVAVPSNRLIGSALCEDGLCLEEEHGAVLVKDELDLMLQVLPADVRQPLVNHPDRGSLLEIVLDLGRRPEARFLGGKGGSYLRDAEITHEDLQHAVEAVGDFGADNRAGVHGTLHRISALRNRKGDVIGLTCRVGRAVMGHTDLMRDLLEGNQSVLFLGRPGVGKTTVIRELARVLADEMHRRVVIVDTSNEIGGDGDVPHPAIGAARRMQVPDPCRQHNVMIEAVENHMPQVVIVDEIGTEAEAVACRTIAERGVQLIGTAHGRFLENLIKNPTLTDLIGGVHCVTLGDDEAKHRKTQKSVLERKGPPTFPLVVEMRERTCWVVHCTEESVDALLQGKIPTVQVRRRENSDSSVDVQQTSYDKVAEIEADDSPVSSTGSYDNDFEATLSSGQYSVKVDGSAAWSDRTPAKQNLAGITYGQEVRVYGSQPSGFMYGLSSTATTTTKSSKRTKARSKAMKERKQQ